MDDILRTKEAAKILKVSEEFIRRLIRSKVLKACKIGNRGGFRIPAREVNKYIKSQLKGKKQ